MSKCVTTINPAVNMTVTVRLARRFRLRVWLGVLLLRAGVAVLGPGRVVMEQPE